MPVALSLILRSFQIGKNNSNDWSGDLLDGGEEGQRTVSDHRTAVDLVQLGAGVREVGTVGHRRILQRISRQSTIDSEPDEGHEVQRAVDDLRICHQRQGRAGEAALEVHDN